MRLDFIDTFNTFLSIALLTTVPPVGVLYGLLALGIGIARKAPSVQEWILGEDPRRSALLNVVFPPPQIEGTPATRAARALAAVQAADGDWYAAPVATPMVAPTISQDALRSALARLPGALHLRQMHPPKSRTAIPIGIAEDGKEIWLDLDAGKPNAVYSLSLTGQPGSGKDTLFKAWVRVLTARNTPEQVQFAIIDGKGSWCVPWIANNAYMFIPPQNGDDAVRVAGKDVPGIAWATDQILQEMRRRYDLIVRQAGCEDREEYLGENPGTVMPLLCVIITDVMGDVEGDVDKMIVKLTSKARAAGIRVFVSMQSTTRQNTQWRSSLGAFVSGAIQGGAQDEVVMGMAPRDLRYRPSHLPQPPESAGVFVVRCGQRQWLVRAPYIEKKEFKEYCRALPQKEKPIQQTPDDLLAELLAHESFAEPRNIFVEVSALERHENVFEISLTPVEVAKIAAKIVRRENQTAIVKAMPGYRADRHAAFVSKYQEIKAAFETEA